MGRRRKWVQRKSLCGHAAINNVFGLQREVVTVDAMKQWAEKLNATDQKADFGGGNGMFHYLVLRLSLKDVGYAMVPVRNEHGNYINHMELATKTAGKFLVVGYSGNEPHWYAADAEAGLVIDSATPGCIKFDAAGLLKCSNYPCCLHLQ